MDAITRHKHAKAEHPNDVCLVLTGDFYETFGSDAEIVAAVVGLTLTTMSKQRRDDVSMVGFPGYMLDDCVRKLEQAGHAVFVS